MDRRAVATSDVVVHLLEQARAKRESAERARRLARSIATDRVSAELEGYAEDRQWEACELEQRACAAAERAEITFGDDLLALVEEARRRIGDYPYSILRSGLLT